MGACRRLAVVLGVVLGAFVAYVAVPHRSARAGAARAAAGELWDVVVVGGGSAGAAAASRLSEGGRRRVLVLEAGGELEPSPLAYVPIAAAHLQHTRVDWAYDTTPQAHSCRGLANNVSQWPRGKVMGGSSVLNYMAWVRGAAADFDRWRDALGVAGWGARDVEPAYRRAERCFYPEGSGEEEEPLATGRGASGTVPIRMRQPSLRTASARFLAAVEAKGVAPLVEDYNVWPGGMPGAGHTQANIGEGGGRQATATTYLGRALRRERAANLRVLTRAHVGRVLFDKSSGDRGEPRATGVEFYAEALGANAPLVARLAEGGEVVLSAGAVGTPLILQRSGVGPRELLEPLGIDVVVANANVGANLQDHIFTPLAVLTNTSTLGNHAITPGAIGEYARGATGPLASDLIEVMAFVDLGTHNETRGAPDIQFHFVPSRADPIYCSAMGFNGTWCDEMVKADAAGVDSYLLLPTLLHPRSTGTINITAADPLAPPAIDANYLSDQRDVRALVRGLQLAADMIASSPLREISTGLMNCVNWPQSFVDKTGLTSPESSPNWNLPNASDEEFWEEYVRTFSLTVYHPTSTCAMGAAEGDSCALPDLRVRGTRGLRVADASAMPDIVSGNTNAACIMIGERVAELMLKDDN